MARKQIVLATDPGVNGATVILWDDGRTQSWSWGGEAEFISLCDMLGESLVDGYSIEWFVEQCPKTTGRGRPESTGFVLGENFGFVKGAIMASGIRMTLVPPKKWQAHFTGLTGKEYKVRKQMCWEEAKRLYPSPCKVTKKNSDAYLILEYAKTITIH